MRVDGEQPCVLGDSRCGFWERERERGLHGGRQSDVDAAKCDSDGSLEIGDSQPGWWRLRVHGVANERHRAGCRWIVDACGDDDERVRMDSEQPGILGDVRHHSGERECERYLHGRRQHHVDRQKRHVVGCREIGRVEPTGRFISLCDVDFDLRYIDAVRRRYRQHRGCGAGRLRLDGDRRRMGVVLGPQRRDWRRIGDLPYRSESVDDGSKLDSEGGRPDCDRDTGGRGKLHVFGLALQRHRSGGRHDRVHHFVGNNRVRMDGQQSGLMDNREPGLRKQQRPNHLYGRR